MTKPTLEQKIVRAIADGDEAVAEALCQGIFGEDAQEWFIGWLLEGVTPSPRRISLCRRGLGCTDAANGGHQSAQSAKREFDFH